MKKFILSVIFLSAFVINPLRSQTVQVNEAQKVAKNFYYERINRAGVLSFQTVKVNNIEAEYLNGKKVFYIVTMSPSGYVIVSATKSVLPVLAYSFDSKTDMNNKPPQFIAWTEQYKKQIEFAITEKIKPAIAVKDEWDRLLTDDISNSFIAKGGKDVAPMLISTWDQGNFYNQMCPEDPAGPAGHCYTGCVATAMGQLCYYFRWPDTGTGSYTYQHPDYGTISADFGETKYDWNGMTNHLSEQNFAVAELLFHLGVSVDMDYGPDGSGMWNHKAAYSLRTYFKYSPETQYLFRDSTNLDWDSVIIAHLNNKIPLYYAGWSEPNVSGHAFICDGYQNEDYFHFNWGWGGSWDGYFYIDTLTPGGSNFNLAQELIINCFPDTANYSYPPLCQGTDTLRSVTGSIDDGSGPAYNYQNNTNCSWLISPQSVEDSVSSIKIFFDKMDTEEGSDFITIYDGDSDSAPVLGQFSGNNLPENIVSSGNKVFVTFISDDSSTGEGWFLHYSCVKPVWCSGMTDLTATIDTLDDGSGNFYYHNGTSCMWHIHPESTAVITVTFHKFKTEADFDVLKIVDGTNNEILAEYSGIYEEGDLPEPVSYFIDDIYLIFYTNQTVTNEGWKMSYYCITTGTDKNIVNNPSIKVFPNPAKEKINISMNIPDKQNLKITVYGLDGIAKKVIGIPNISGVFSKEIGIKGLPKGIYFISVKGETVNFTDKIVKE